MQNWVFFFNLIFWLSLFCFILSNFNIIQLLLISEFCWTIIYVYTALLSGYTDDITLLTLTFFILGLAGLEFSIGFVLTIVLNFFFKKNDLTNKKDRTLKLEQKFNQNIKRYTHII